MFKTAKKRLGSFQSPLKEMQKPLYYRRENAVLSPRRIPSAAADGGSSIFSFISGEKIAPGKKSDIRTLWMRYTPQTALAHPSIKDYARFPRFSRFFSDGGGVNCLNEREYEGQG